MFLSRGCSCEAIAAFTRQGLGQAACSGLGLGQPRQSMRLLRGGVLSTVGLSLLRDCSAVRWLWGLAITLSLGRCFFSFPIEGLVIGNWPLTGFDGNPRS